jgi:7,8-dihydropterin-6-yl-methyl-4-(beta-D-ribofuranosyl)aminobenzene 5'-phosphate synthase
MHYTVTTLVENAVAQSGKALLGEHGLSFYIEAGDRKILFDTGQNMNSKIVFFSIRLGK